MLNKGKNQLVSVVNPVTNRLAVTSGEIKQVLVDHFRSALNGEDEKISPVTAEHRRIADQVYAKKSGIDERWFEPLMQPTTNDELIKTLRSGKYVVAPGGRDSVSTGVWRCAAERDGRVLASLVSFVNACIRLRYMPTVGRDSVIVPILKKPSEERNTANLRPISLQCGLTKILCKLLALRLTGILAAHPVLHDAQEAFLRGRSSFKCVDICLDIWEHARRHRKTCVNVFYDIRAAYDSVRHEDLLRALRRLSLPPAFVEFVATSLQNLSSCVRTAYGCSAWFSVTRSVRQGDPLAPILYICFMDPLHCGLECNPCFDGSRDGYRIGSIVIASKGFADDTWIVSDSIAGLTRLHYWVVVFCMINGLVCMKEKRSWLGGPNQASVFLMASSQSIPVP